MAINTTSISNRPQITPYELLRQLQTARARGGPADYYGVGAALRGVGNDYEQMQRDMDQQRGFNARADSGYYPAQAESAVSQFNLNQYQNQSKLQQQQDLKNAFQQALAEGKQPGTPEFEMALQQKLTTQGGMDSRMKERTAALKEMMNQRLYVDSIKKATQAQIVNKFADAWKQMHQQQYIADGMAKKEDPRMTLQRLNQDAQQAGVQHFQDSGLQVQFDPNTMNITAKDNQGNEVPLDPVALAAGAKIMGNGAAYDLFRNMAADRFMAENQGRVTVNSKGQVSMTSGSATQGTAGTRTTKATPTELDKEVELNHKLRLELAKAHTKEGADTSKIEDMVRDSDERIVAMRQQGSVNAPVDTSDAAKAMVRGGAPVLMPQGDTGNPYTPLVQGQGQSQQPMPAGEMDFSSGNNSFGMATPADYQIGIPQPNPTSPDMFGIP